MAYIVINESDLQKLTDALDAAAAHHTSRDASNAALHLAREVRYSPLTATLVAEQTRARRELADAARYAMVRGIRDPADMSDGLLGALRKLGDTYGPMGVASAAAALVDDGSLVLVSAVEATIESEEVPCPGCRTPAEHP